MYIYRKEKQIIHDQLDKIIHYNKIKCFLLRIFNNHLAKKFEYILLSTKVDIFFSRLFVNLYIIIAKS